MSQFTVQIITVSFGTLLTFIFSVIAYYLTGQDDKKNEIMKELNDLKYTLDNHLKDYKKFKEHIEKGTI